ncbi:MAG: DUF418 domain-containing protein [Corynebacterium sp.]|uniref:DUF418 domain-containing protein n=1 Tax=uncultured Corynebacterium sp. TaxID=159447 RepID=UPI0017E6D94B|nr:DUF418 domain-containing protein [uncultured Corynebacterium sp.]NLZ57853.1 DUF418 domain-containing protein [Corynebacterium sp.]
MTTPGAVPAEPTRKPERSAQKHRILSPDIARGIALLGIALANVATAWVVPEASLKAGALGGLVNGSIWEEIMAVISAMFIHVRGLPMFSTMLGYGVGMIVTSLWRRQYPEGKARGILTRRYGFLAVFGLAHMIFLFWGDIMFFYGVAGMLFAAIMTFKDKTLWWVAGVLFTINALIMGGALLAMSMLMDGDLQATVTGSAFDTFESYGEYLLFALFMVVGQIAAVPMEILMLFPVMIVGYIAARHRVLSRVDEFLKPLWAAVGIALAVAVFIGLPWGLAEIGVLPNAWATLFSGLNQAVGALTGPGIVASIALLVQPLQRRMNAQAERGEKVTLPLLPRMIAALGARSMSGYIMQSFLLLIITQPFTLGLGIGQGILGASAVALVVWLITVFLAFALELAGRRGPFEAIHRRVSYGKKGLQDPYVDPHHPQAFPSAGDYRPIPGAQPLHHLHPDEGEGGTPHQ